VQTHLETFDHMLHVLRPSRLAAYDPFLLALALRYVLEVVRTLLQVRERRGEYLAAVMIMRMVVVLLSMMMMMMMMIVMMMLTIFVLAGEDDPAASLLPAVGRAGAPPGRAAPRGGRRATDAHHTGTVEWTVVIRIKS
jgi:hypothetical protein